MNEQFPFEQHAYERAGFAAALYNIMTSEELTHDNIKFMICQMFGKMIEDGNVVGDPIDQALAEACKNFAEEHNAVVEVNRMLNGE